MKQREYSADASFYFHEDATADAVRMDTSAVYGNIADAMRNATILLPAAQVLEKIVASSVVAEQQRLGEGSE